MNREKYTGFFSPIKLNSWNWLDWDQILCYLQMDGHDTLSNI